MRTDPSSSSGSPQPLPPSSLAVVWKDCCHSSEGSPSSFTVRALSSTPAEDQSIVTSVCSFSSAMAVSYPPARFPTVPAAPGREVRSA